MQGPLASSVAPRSALYGAESTPFRPHPGRGHEGRGSVLHRIENAEGQSLHDIRGELRDATRAALWEADSPEEAGVLVGNALRDVLVEHGFDVDAVLEAVQSREGRAYGRDGHPRGLGFGPFGLRALQYAEAPVEPPPVEGPATVEDPAPPDDAPPVDDPSPDAAPVATGVDLEIESAEADDDHDDGTLAGRFELQLQLEAGSGFTLKLEVEGAFPTGDGEDAASRAFEAAKSVMDAFFARFAPGSLVSTTA